MCIYSMEYLTLSCYNIVRGFYFDKFVYLYKTYGDNVSTCKIVNWFRLFCFVYLN